MISMTLKLEPDEPVFPVAEGEVVRFASELHPLEVATLGRGMESGRPSVAMRCRPRHRREVPRPIRWPVTPMERLIAAGIKPCLHCVWLHEEVVRPCSFHLGLVRQAGEEHVRKLQRLEAQRRRRTVMSPAEISLTPPVAVG